MAVPPQQSEPKGQDRALTVLLASIADLQGSIKANDSKASAALIVHGLLFTGILTILGKTGSTYAHATAAERVVAFALLVAALACFLVSVGYLIRAISPYRPQTTEAELVGRYPRAFFPILDELRSEGQLFDVLRARVDELKLPERTYDELAAEMLKLADILRFESGHAGRGYRYLRYELLAVATFLVYAAAIAIAVH